MKFRLIPPGEFLMGSTREEIEDVLKKSGEEAHFQACVKSEAPQHNVILTLPLYLGMYEVSQAEYEKVMAVNPSHFSPLGEGKEAVMGMETTDHPVTMVSWNDAAEFCAKLSEQEKLQPFYILANGAITPLNGTGYRVPTEAEWEYSCRAGTTMKFWIGNNDDDLIEAGWFDVNAGGRTHAAGELKANPFGLHDIHGNAWEWVEDAWDPTFYSRFQEQPAINPRSPSPFSSDERVYRGGDWGHPESSCRSSHRKANNPTYRYPFFGFRVSLPVDAVRQALKVTGPTIPQSLATNSAAETDPSEKLPATFTNSLGMEFVKVPKGTGWLGGGGGKPGEQKVEFTDDFYLGKYEVTQEEWVNLMGVNRSHFSRIGNGRDAVKDIPDADLRRFPVEGVSWDECQALVELLNKRVDDPGWVYRLPTSAEWEYACRGGPMSDRFDSGFDFFFDKPSLVLGKHQANFDNALKRTCKVGSYKPNALGLYDLHGNVWEWLVDISGPNLKEWPNESSTRVLRGGSWENLAERCVAASNNALPPSALSIFVGVRLARVRVQPTDAATFKNALGMEFVKVPKGTGWLGGGGGKPGEQKVEIPDDFYLGKYEVTQEEWEKVTGLNPSHFSRTGAGKDAVNDISDADLKRFPVDSVSWNGCQAFCERLNKMLAEPGWMYQLPTTQEWEYACRGGPVDRFDSAFDFYLENLSLKLLPGQANVSFDPEKGLKGVWQPCRVGSYPPNRLGLCDMHGNLNEWCVGEFAGGKVLKGSHAGLSIKECRAANFFTDGPDKGASSYSFRLARVRVSPSQPMPNPTKAPIDFAAERKAAERLLRLGKGTVILGNNDRQRIGPLKAPLPAEPFCIVEANFLGADLTDDELAALSGCRAMESLLLHGNRRLTSAGLSKLGALPFLTDLLIGESGIDDAVVPWLANAPALTNLEAVNTPIGTAGWSTMPPCPRLKKLRTSGTVGDAGLRRIVEQCPELREFALTHGGSVTDLSPLARLTRLRQLASGPNTLSDAGIDTLLKLPVLDELFVDWPDPAGIVRLRKLAPKLTQLTLRVQGDQSLLPNSAAWAPVTEMSGLLRLTIGSHIAVDGPALRRIAAMPNLRRLGVGDDTDRARFRTFTPDDIAAFRKARPDVELDINGQNFPALDDWPGKFEGSTSVADWTELPPGGPAPATATFTPEVAQQRQDEWAKHLGQPVEVANSAGMKFRLIPPSEATVNIGTPEQPRLALQRVETPYYLGTTEVTVGQFKQFVEATGYVTEVEKTGTAMEPWTWQTNPKLNWKTPGFDTKSDMPVMQIQPADAIAFCRWLSEKDGHDYRLPLATEWSHAVRGGGLGRLGWCSTADIGECGWFKDNIPDRRQPVQLVAQKRPNPFGLHDVLGNVWEFCHRTDVLASDCVRVGPGWAASPSENDYQFDRSFAVASSADVGFRVLRQVHPSGFTKERKYLDKPLLLARGAPLGPQTVVTRPSPIPGVRSWSIEFAAHQASIDFITWSPLGDVIATAGEDRSVRLWDRDGHLKSILIAHAGSVWNSQSLSFSPDGLHLATVDSTSVPFQASTLRIWNINDGASEAVIPLSAHGHCVAWSPDGRSIAFGGHEIWPFCAILDAATGQTRPLHDLTEAPRSLAWSADSATVCVALRRKLPSLFDATTGNRIADLTIPDQEKITKEHADARTAAWSSDGRKIAAVTGKLLHIWDAESHQHIRTSAFTSLILSLAWLNDNQWLVIVVEGGPEGCLIVNAMSGDVVTEGFKGVGRGRFACSPDGNEIVFTTDKGLQFVDARTGKLLRIQPDGGRKPIRDMFQPPYLTQDGQRFHVKTGDNERSEFDAETGQLVDRLKTLAGACRAVAPDDAWRAYVQSGTKVVLEPKRFDHDPVTITTPGPSEVWRSDATGERIAAAHDRHVLIWDTESAKEIAQLPHPVRVWSFEWSPDGKQIATAADDKVIRIWDTTTHQITAEFQTFPQALNVRDYQFGAPILAWTRDGRSVWIPLGDKAGLLELSNGKVTQFDNLSFKGSTLYSLTLAADSERLLTHGVDMLTFLRDRDGTRQFLGQFLGARPCWHPDARRFLSGHREVQSSEFYGVRGYDVATRRRLGTLWPTLTDNHWLCVGPTGHYRGSEGVEEHIVYVAQLDDGSHITLSPAEFAKRFSWKNDPEKATLLKLEE